MARGRYFGEKWKLGRLLGSGGFGSVYEAIDRGTGRKYAVKVEKKRLRYIRKEYFTYRQLQRFQAYATPRVYFFGHFNRKYDALVMDCLGSSLRDKADRYGCLHPRQAVEFGLQAIRRLKFIHDSDFIHQDIKPDNMMTGRGNNAGRLYLVDFGLAAKYRYGGKHVNFYRKAGIAGTKVYASVHAHRGDKLSRRDDMESLGYTILEWFRGHLPWYGMSSERTLNMKQYGSVDRLCTSFYFPMRRYFKHIRGLRFKDMPNYSYLSSALRSVLYHYARQ